MAVSWTGRRMWAAPVIGLLALSATPAAAAARTAAGPVRPAISPVTEFSRGCAGQNAEVEQATDPARGYVYEEWMGCQNQIGFAASADGGRHSAGRSCSPDRPGPGTRRSPSGRAGPCTRPS